MHDFDEKMMFLTNYAYVGGSWVPPTASYASQVTFEWSVVKELGQKLAPVTHRGAF